MHERPHAEAKAAEAMPGSVVGARSLVTGIDLQSPRLSTVQVELLQALSDRHQDYIRQGRGREAHAMTSAMLIVWRTFCGLPAPQVRAAPLLRERV